MVAKPENPWKPGEPYDPPAWRLERRQANFKVRCPECGAVERPWYVGGDSPDVRCRLCNARFNPDGKRCAA